MMTLSSPAQDNPLRESTSFSCRCFIALSTVQNMFQASCLVIKLALVASRGKSSLLRRSGRFPRIPAGNVHAIF